MRILWTLYRAFFMIGALTFGGGYAMLPMLEREIVTKHKWATQEELLDYFAIGQCTPGIIAVNTATFIGYKQRGIVGGIVATLGVVSPSIVIIMAIAAVLTSFMDVTWVQHAFAGIRVAVCALIVASVIKLAKSNVRSWHHIVLATAAFVLVGICGFSPVYIVVGCALAGVTLGKRCEKHE